MIINRLKTKGQPRGEIMCNSSALFSQIRSLASTILIGCGESDITETSRESRRDVSNLKVLCSDFYPCTGCFIMFSVITNTYNKKTK